MASVLAINGRHPDDGKVRIPYQDGKDHHDCLWCGAYVNTECVRCGELIMSMIPNNDAMNCMMDICYQCELSMLENSDA